MAILRPWGTNENPIRFYDKHQTILGFLVLKDRKGIPSEGSSGA